MTPYSWEIEQQKERFYSSLNKKDSRRYAAIEAVKLGWGGMSYISQLFCCDYDTLHLGKEELGDEAALGMREIRRAGGGRKSALESIPDLETNFLAVLAQHTAGSPMDETVKWTNLKRQEIAELLQARGIEVSVTVVDQLLEKHHYRKRKAQKRLSTGAHPQRNEQFEKIEEWMETYGVAGDPVISMDTKKKN